MRAIYRYSINGQSVTPRMGNDVTKDYEMDGNQKFFRIKLSGKIAFVGVDFDYLHAQDFDTDFIFLIERYSNGAWTSYVTSKFNKTDCKWDLDDRIVDVTLSPYDDYTAVLDSLDKEFNLIELLPELESVIVQKRPLIQAYIPGESTLSCFLGGSYWEQDCSEISSPTELTNTYKFALASQLMTFDVRGVCSPPEIISAYGGTVGNNFVNNGGLYKFTYTTDAFFHYFTITRISDNQAMFTGNAAGTNLSIEVKMLPVAGSGATGEIYAWGRSVNVYMRYLLDVDTLNGNATFPIPAIDITENNQNYKKCYGYNFNLAIVYTNYLTTPTKYGKNDYGTYFAAPGTLGQKYYPISRSKWSNASIWFKFYELDFVLEEKGRKAYKLKDTYPLYSVISVLLGQIAPSITHGNTIGYSEFFYSGLNPIANYDFKVFITQKSNILAGNYDQAAQKAPITIGDVFNMLRDVYRVFWYIEDNKLKLEHIKWFNNGGAYTGAPTIGTDITTLVYRKNGKKWGFDSSSWEFDKSSLPERIEFSWMDDVTEAFDGFPINIIDKYVSKGNVEQVQVSKFTPDIDYMLLNPSAISRDGFALMAAIKTNLYDSSDADIKMGYLYMGQSLILDSNYNTTGYMPVIPSDTYEGIHITTLNWYDSAKAFISSMAVPEDGSRLIAPPNAAYARVSIAVAYWNTFYFQNVAYSLPFIDKTVDGADLYIQNGLVSWLSLHENYHVYDLPAKNVTINGEAFVALGVKRSKKQNIEFPSSEDPNLFHLIKTYLGDGQIEKISINLASQMNKITLKYDTE